MRVAIAKIDEATGRIEGVSRISADYVDQQVRERGVVAVEISEELSYWPLLHETHYGQRSAGAWEVVERPALPASIDKTVILADDIDAVTITGIPEESRLTVDGEDMGAVSGEVSITSPLQASYDVLIACWPYLPWRQSITAEQP